MQRLTNNMMEKRISIIQKNPEDVRLRLSEMGYLDASVIIHTDNTVKISIDKNIYNLSANLGLIQEYLIVSDSGTLELSKKNYGIQELLVNMEKSNDDPAYGEILDYTLNENTITLNTDEYNGKKVFVKYISFKND